MQAEISFPIAADMGKEDGLSAGDLLANFEICMHEGRKGEAFQEALTAAGSSTGVKFEIAYRLAVLSACCTGADVLNSALGELQRLSQAEAMRLTGGGFNFPVGNEYKAISLLNAADLVVIRYGGDRDLLLRIAAQMPATAELEECFQIQWTALEAIVHPEKADPARVDRLRRLKTAPTSPLEELFRSIPE